jgi:DNA-binding protein H-NS
MAKIPDLSSYSMEELAEIVAAANKRSDELKREKIAELKHQRAALDAELAKLGSTGGGHVVGNPRKRASPAPKYRDDNGNTWSGRGATPKWLAAYEAEGRKREDFAI